MVHFYVFYLFQLLNLLNGHMESTFYVLLIPWFCTIIHVLSKKEEVTSASILMLLCSDSTIFIAETENPSAGITGHALRVLVIIQPKFLFVSLQTADKEQQIGAPHLSSSNPETDLWRQPSLCSNR